MNHLPTPQYDHNTMTTLGVPVKDLTVQFHPNLSYHLPMPLGYIVEDRLAYAVLPTWTHLSLSWQEAAQLAKIAGQIENIAELKEHPYTLPETFLFSRLSKAAFPHNIIDNPYQHLVWESFVDDVLKKGEKALTSCPMLFRTEAAELCKVLAQEHNITTKQDVNLLPKNSLLSRLVNAAAPLLLFAQTGHKHMDGLRVQDNVLRQGKEALPDFLKA